MREDFAEFFPATLELALAGLALGVVVGVATAIGAEVFRAGWARAVSGLLGTLGLTVPVFWIGLLLLLGIDHFLDMARSATNVIGNSVATAAVSRWEGQLRAEGEIPEDLAEAIKPVTPRDLHG